MALLSTRVCIILFIILAFSFGWLKIDHIIRSLSLDWIMITKQSDKIFPKRMSFVLFCGWEEKNKDLSQPKIDIETHQQYMIFSHERTFNFQHSDIHSTSLFWFRNFGLLLLWTIEYQREKNNLTKNMLHTKLEIV